MKSIIDAERLAGVELTGEETRRYARHLTIPDVGAEGQRKLKASKVLCIGAGGLGSPAAMYLAAAGVGEIGLVDFDRVEFSNLQRQLLHGTSDVGRPKVESAAERLADINPGVRVRPIEERFHAGNAAALAEPYDLILDGTDNFATRYLSNDLSVLSGKPNVYGSIFRFEGQVSVFAPSLGGPCYRCLFPEPPAPGQVPSCAEGGVLGVLPGIVGALQANEAVKLLLGLGEPLVGRLLHIDALTMRIREIRLRRDPACAVCGGRPSITSLQDIEAGCAAAGDAAADSPPEIGAGELSALIAGTAPPVLVDVREPAEAAVCRLPGSLLIPLGELPGRLAELDRAAATVVHCKSGARSARAVRVLSDAGFREVRHLRGGIDAWAEEIDPSLPRY